VTAFGDVAFTEAIKEGIRVDLKTPIWLVSLEEIWTDTQMETMWRLREKVVTYKPRRKTFNGTSSPDTFILDSNLQNCEEVKFCCWSSRCVVLFMVVIKVRLRNSNMKEFIEAFYLLSLISKKKKSKI
jgi:hypothetical protein